MKTWKDFKYDVLYKRFYKGFCNRTFAPYDAWNLNDEMVDWLLRRVLILMNEHIGTPVDVVNEAVERGLITPEERDEFYRHDPDYEGRRVDEICCALWSDILFDIAKGLASYRCMHTRTNRFYKKDYDDDVEREIVAWETTCRTRFNESMQLLFKYFDNLWD